MNALLDNHERTSLSALLRPADQRRYLLAHGLVRLLLAELVDRPPEALTFGLTCLNCSRARQPVQTRHGKPHLVDSDVHFSLSHAGNRVLIAISRDEPVGVDVERIAAARFPGFDQVALSDAEHALIVSSTAPHRARAVLWARKEAMLKASGWGLAFDPTLLTLSSPEQAPEPAQTALGHYRLADLQVGSGYAASVATQSLSPLAPNDEVQLEPELSRISSLSG